MVWSNWKGGPVACEPGLVRRYFFCLFSWSLRWKSFLLSHYRTQDWSSVRIYWGVSGDSGCCLSTLTQLYTEEKITTWMGQACESARFCPDRIYFSWSSVLMASSSQLVSPQSLQRKSPKTEFKTIQTPSMGTAERSSDNVYFKEFRVGLYHRKMFSQNKCLFYFSLIISDFFQAE